MAVVTCGFALGLAACEGGAPQPDCAGAATTMTRTPGYYLEANAAAAKVALQKLCVEDKWPERGASCIRGAPSLEGARKCHYDHLTQKQVDHLDDLIISLRPADTREGEAMEVMEKFRDKMCSCKDALCAKRVSDELTRWSQEKASQTREPTRLSEANQKRATEIGTEMGECMQRAFIPADPAPEN